MIVRNDVLDLKNALSRLTAPETVPVAPKDCCSELRGYESIAGPDLRLLMHLDRRRGLWGICKRLIVSSTMRLKRSKVLKSDDQ